MVRSSAPLAAAALALAASAGSPGATLADSPAGAFSHERHGEQECGTCHAGAERSTTGLDELLPSSEAVCLDCHEPAEIGAPSWKAPPTQHPEFSHRRHVKGERVACASCHGASGGRVATHESCFSCHRPEERPDECGACHGNLSERKPLDHAEGFLHTHAFEVRGTPGTECARCHAQSQLCLDCHAGENVDFLSHPRNYRFYHAEEARKRIQDCSACHAVERFCTECHVQEGVLPLDHLSAEWTGAGGGSHATAAARDLAYCASCHDTGEEPVCARCHGR